MALPKVLVLITTDERTGEPVSDGDIVTNFHGERARFVKAERARDYGRSGKIVVDPVDGSPRRYLYDNTFDLRVDGLLDCGCTVLTYTEHGHRDGCDGDDE